MRRYQSLRILMAVCLFTAARAGAAVVYVDRAAPGPVYDGASWRTAFATVQEATMSAQAGDELWVAAGTYPERVALMEGISLYGGFSGTETARSARDPRRHETVLDAGYRGAAVSDTSAVQRDTVLDGFTICHGGLVVDGVPDRAYIGGALRLTGSPTVSHCVIRDNIALYGSGAFAMRGSPRFEANLFTGNGAFAGLPVGLYGAGIVCADDSAEIYNNVFVENVAAFGTAVYAYGPGRVRMVGNSVLRNAGVAIDIHCRDAVFANNLVADNDDGAKLIPNGGTYQVTHNAFHGNRTDLFPLPDGIDYLGSVPAVMQDPRLAPDGLTLTAGSPCVDAGFDAAADAAGLDYADGPRRRGRHVDIGAVESPFTAPLPAYRIVCVSPHGNDANSGLGWSHAKRTVEAAWAEISPEAGGEVWLAEGRYLGPIRACAWASLYGGFAGNELRRAQRNPAVRRTVIVAPRRGASLLFPRGVPRSVVVEGLTFEVDKATFLGGTHVQMIGASPTLRGLRFSWGDGAVVCSSGSSPLIQACEFRATAGTALRFEEGAAEVVDCTIAASGAEAVYCDGNQAIPTIRNCTIAGNLVGVAFSRGARPVLVNNIIAFNGIGVLASAKEHGQAVSRHNDVYGNPDGDYVGLPDPVGRDGNIRLDPQLADAARGNLHIQPNSPCRRAGEGIAVLPGETDIDGQPRYAGRPQDIGADLSDGRLWRPQPRVLYVRPDGRDAGDGRTWSTAKGTIQAAIDAAEGGACEIWVARGVYQESLAMPAYITLLGGFTGRESLRGQRDWVRNETVLLPGKYDTVTATSGYRLSTLDGFVLKDAPNSRGGTLVGCYGPSLCVANCTFYCSGYAMVGASIIRNCRVYGQASTVAVSCSRTVADIDGLYVSVCTTGVNAEGVRLRLRNSVIRAARTAAVVAGHGSEIVGNTLIGSGSGIVYAGEHIIVGNNLLADNTIGVRRSSGPGPIPNPATITFTHNAFYGNSANTHVLEDPVGRDGNIGTDPMLVSAWFGDPRIRPGSPCIDAGDSSLVRPTDTALDGHPRVIGAGVDIGADESDGGTRPTSPRIVRVSPAGDDANDGSSWDRAVRTLAAAVQPIAETGLEVWVAAGYYHETAKPGSYTYVYGGFSGTESTRDERDWTRHATVLEGDRRRTCAEVTCSRSGLDGFTVRNGMGANVKTGGSAFVEHCTIIDATYDPGTGIIASTGAPLIRNNFISGSGGACSGGSGIEIRGAARVIGNTIVGNRGYGGVTVMGASGGGQSPILANNIIAANSAGVTSTSSRFSLRMVANDVYANGAHDYVRVPDPTGQDGNISADPLFVDPANGDFRLLAGSPCIDAGDDTQSPGDEDLAGSPRVLGLHVDMGAFEAGPSTARVRLRALARW